MKKEKKRHGHSEKVHCVVKRRTGKCQKYDEKKVYGSVYAACYVVFLQPEACERTAEAVAKAVTKHIHKKKSVSSHEISKLVAKELKKRNKHAAYMYETHRDIA